MAAPARLVDLTALAIALALAAAVMVPTAARQHDEPQTAPASRTAVTTPATPVTQMHLAQAAQQSPLPDSRRPARPGDRNPQPRRSLDPELIEQCLEVANDVDPELAERLGTIRREQPAEDFARAIRDARHLVRLARLRNDDPQLYDAKVKELRIDARVDRLLEELVAARSTSDGTALDLEARLHGLVQQQVAFSFVARGMYLRRLSDQMKALRDQLDHDLGHFQQAVDRRMKLLLDELDEGAAAAASN
jgi:hypothetical protein